MWRNPVSPATAVGLALLVAFAGAQTVPKAPDAGLAASTPAARQGLGQAGAMPVAVFPPARPAAPNATVRPAAVPATAAQRALPAALTPAGAGAAAGAAAAAAAAAAAGAAAARRALTVAMQVAADKWRLRTAEAASFGHLNMAGKMSVCISPYTPDIYCDPLKPSSSYAGYGVSVFEQIARRVPWLRDARAWDYRCVEWATMEEDLKNSSSRGCMLGLMMNPSSAGEWIASRAINQEGLQIITRRKRSGSKDLFSPFAAFTWQLWLMLFGTAFAVAIVLWFFDVIAKGLYGPEEKEKEEEDEDGDKVKRDKSEAPLKVDADPKADPTPKKDIENGDGHAGKGGDKDGDGAVKPVKNSAGRRWLHAMGVQPGKEGKSLQRLDENLRNAALHLARAGKPPFGVTLPAQIVLWAWGLTSMICLSLYTGATAALLTTSSLTEGISGRSDLIGKAVGTWTDYVPRLREAGIPAVGYPWENIADEARMLEDLRSGAIAALVMDANFVQYTDGRNCDLVAVGGSFLVNDIGISFDRAVDGLLVSSLDDAIQELVETGEMERLRDIHVGGLGGKCSAANFRVEKSTAVRVSQVLGLWVVLGLATLTGATMLVVLYFNKRARTSAAGKAIMDAARSLSRSLSRPMAPPPLPAVAPSVRVAKD